MRIVGHRCNEIIYNLKSTKIITKQLLYCQAFNMNLTFAKSRNHYNFYRRIFLQFFPILQYSSNKMSTPAPERSPCVFCNIVNKLEPTEILYEDEDVCVFRDIKPASKYHILTIPKTHIEDVKALTPDNKQLIEKMLTISNELLTKNNLDENDARFGYHWPPFRSVKHLHLHTIAPESEMGFISRLVFKKDSYWFVSPEYVASML